MFSNGLSILIVVALSAACQNNHKEKHELQAASTSALNTYNKMKLYLNDKYLRCTIQNFNYNESTAKNFLIDCANSRTSDEISQTKILLTSITSDIKATLRNKLDDESKRALFSTYTDEFEREIVKLDGRQAALASTANQPEFLELVAALNAQGCLYDESAKPYIQCSETDSIESASKQLKILNVLYQVLTDPVPNLSLRNPSTHELRNGEHFYEMVNSISNLRIGQQNKLATLKLEQAQRTFVDIVKRVAAAAKVIEHRFKIETRFYGSEINGAQLIEEWAKDVRSLSEYWIDEKISYYSSLAESLEELSLIEENSVFEKAILRRSPLTILVDRDCQFASGRTSCSTEEQIRKGTYKKLIIAGSKISRTTVSLRLRQFLGFRTNDRAVLTN